MDAKAKVVRWECRPLNWEVQYQQRDDGEWVKFTDHEAALAELKDQALADVTGKLKAELAQRKTERALQTLLSGLEALAGEIEWMAGNNNADEHKRWARTIRTLASAGLEGNRE